MAAQAVADLKEQNTKIFLILGVAAGILAAALSASNGKAMRYAIAALAVTVLAFALGAILERKREKDWRDVWCLSLCLPVSAAISSPSLHRSDILMPHVLQKEACRSLCY